MNNIIAKSVKESNWYFSNHSERHKFYRPVFKGKIAINSFYCSSGSSGGASLDLAVPDLLGNYKFVLSSSMSMDGVNRILTGFSKDFRILNEPYQLQIKGIFTFNKTGRHFILKPIFDINEEGFEEVPSYDDHKALEFLGIERLIL